MAVITSPTPYTQKGRTLAEGVNQGRWLDCPLRKVARLYDDAGAGAVTIPPIFYNGMFAALDEKGAATPAWHGDLLSGAGKNLYGQFGLLRWNNHSPGAWVKGWESATPPVEHKPTTYYLDYTDYPVAEPDEYYTVTPYGTTIDDHRGCSLCVDGSVVGVPIEKGDLVGVKLRPGMEVYIVDPWRLTVDNTDVTNAYAVGRLEAPTRGPDATFGLDLWKVMLYPNALDPVPAPLSA